MAKVPNGEEKMPKISTGWVKDARTLQTTDIQTSRSLIKLDLQQSSNRGPSVKQHLSSLISVELSSEDISDFHMDSNTATSLPMMTSTLADTPPAGAIGNSRKFPMRGEWLRCCGPWYHRQRRDQGGKCMILFVILLHWWDDLECTAEQFSVEWCLPYTDWWGLGSLLKGRWSMRLFNNAFYYFR